MMTMIIMMRVVVMIRTGMKNDGEDDVISY